MTKKESFFVNRLKSVGFAFKGMLILVKTEPSIKIQLVVALIATLAGFYFEITTIEWMFQIAMIGLVLSIEGVNTAIEYLADFIHPEHHTKIGLIKDIAAGAVFIASIVAVIIGIFIYLPKML
ncbi:diacylglycerol kinase family protein [Paucihalobacter sp.]|uniref:diacylglycerol kinase family protein n=1 Tax=Paucihalobacter sp. TaxID=2850405 RepID=UPI002FE3971F